MKRLTKRSIVILVLIAAGVSATLADIRIKRRVIINKKDYESTIYLKGARQRTETRHESNTRGKYFDIAFVEQCDLKQMIWIDLSNKRFAVHTGGIPAAAVMAFNESQLPADKQRMQQAEARARKKGLLSATTTVIDTGERKEMFGLMARRLKTSTVWTATPKTCDRGAMTFETDGWYADLYYGIDCSPDLSGSIKETNFGGSKCFSDYAIKKGYWIEHKRNGPSSLGYPLMEIKTWYDEKGEAQIVREEVVELSTNALDASLFDLPAGFTKVDFKTGNPSFFRSLFSFI